MVRLYYVSGGVITSIPSVEKEEAVSLSLVFFSEFIHSGRMTDKDQNTEMTAGTLKIFKRQLNGDSDVNSI